MKRLFVFIAFILSANQFTTAQSMLPYADLAQVVKQFDGEYQYYIYGTTYLRLAKKPVGWVVTEAEYGTARVVKEYLFWERATGKFLALPFKKGNGRHLYNAVAPEAYRLERNYYYGYPGDNRDVIKELEGKTNLTDTALEGLARAYSAVAGSFVDNVSGYDTGGMAPGQGVPEKFADSFIKYENKAIEIFKKLYRQNPYYETLVGNVYIKYCNEHIYAYTTLAEWGHDEKAKKYLVKGLYNSAMLSWARNVLYSADDNSIVFTNGDNDTYPVLYLQLTENFKKQVNILNISLLGKPRFIASIRNGYGGFQRVALTLPQEVYNSGKLEYLQVDKSNTSPGKKHGTVEELLRWIEANYTKTNENGALTVSVGDSLYLPVSAAPCILNNLLEPGATQPQHIALQLKRYLVLHDVAILDIIRTNNWARTVYFAEGYDNVDYSAHLRYTGMLKLLHPLKNGGETKPIDEKRLYANLMSRFEFVPDPAFKGANGPGFKTNVYTLRAPYGYLRDGVTDAEKKQAVARKAIAIVPDSYTAWDETILLMALQLVKEDKIADAEDILIKTVNNLYYDYEQYNPLVKFYWDKNAEKERLQTYIQYIEQEAAGYKMERLMAEVGRILKKLETE